MSHRRNSDGRLGSVVKLSLGGFSGKQSVGSFVDYRVIAPSLVLLQLFHAPFITHLRYESYGG